MARKIDRNLPAEIQPAGLMPADQVRARLNRILDAGLKFHEWVWFEKDRNKVRRFLKRHQEEVRFKQQSFSKFFDRVMPVKVLHERGPDSSFSMDQLAKRNLSMADIKKLAGIESDERPEEQDHSQKWDYDENEEIEVQGPEDEEEDDAC